MDQSTKKKPVRTAASKEQRKPYRAKQNACLRLRDPAPLMHQWTVDIIFEASCEQSNKFTIQQSKQKLKVLMS